MHLVCDLVAQLQNEKAARCCTTERLHCYLNTQQEIVVYRQGATCEQGETKRENEGAQEKLSTFFVRIQSQIPNETRPESLVKYRKEKYLKKVLRFFGNMASFRRRTKQAAEHTMKTSAQVKQSNIAAMTFRLQTLEDQREMIELRGNVEEMILHERKISQVLNFLEALTA